MAESPSEVDLESDASSVDKSRYSIRHDKAVQHRLDSLTQENRVLKTEVETLKFQVKSLTEQNNKLRQESVDIQAKAEQEEEFISNTLLKKITELKKEKEFLAINYEQEEECLTNDLNKKYFKLKKERDSLEKSLAQEQEKQISKLHSRIEKLENDVKTKQSNLDKLRREKIELENALEQEQEALVHRLWKKMEKLEAEKRFLQEKLETFSNPLSSSSSVHNLENNDSSNSEINRGSSNRNSLRSNNNEGLNPESPVQTNNNNQNISRSTRSLYNSNKVDLSLSFLAPMEVDAEKMGPPVGGDGQKTLPPKQRPQSTDKGTPKYSTVSRLRSRPDSADFSVYVQQLREEVVRLRSIVNKNQMETAERLALFDKEHASAEEVNRRLKVLLKNEMDRRDALSRQLSESESSLEMEDERHYNEASRARSRTTSDCASSVPALPIGLSSYPDPGHAYAIAVGALCKECGQTMPNLTPPGSRMNSSQNSNYNSRSRPVSISNMPTDDLDDDDRAITPPLKL